MNWNGSSSETPDLDLIALIFDKFGFVLECCFWGQRSTSGNAVFHSGDCRPSISPPSDGRNEESIFIDLARLPPHQHSVALCVVSAGGQPFSAANAAEISLVAFSASSARVQQLAGNTASPTKRRPTTPGAPIGTPSSSSSKQGKTVGKFALTAGKLHVCTRPSELLLFCSRCYLCIHLLYNTKVLSLNLFPPLQASVTLAMFQHNGLAAGALKHRFARHKLSANGAENRTHAASGVSYALSLYCKTVLTLLQLGVSERPHIVVETCNAMRPTPSLRGSSEQYQVPDRVI